MVDIMKIEKIEKYLEEVSEGTDFSFTVEEEKNKEITLYMQSWHHLPPQKGAVNQAATALIPGTWVDKKVG